MDFDLVDESDSSIALWTRPACDSLGFEVLRAARRTLKARVRGTDAGLLWPVARGEEGSADRLLARVDARAMTPVASGLFVWLANTLEASFLLIASVPPPVDRRRVLKFRYEHADAPPGHDLGLLARLGLRPSAITFLLPGLDYGEPYHFELRAPDDLLVVSATAERADRYGLCSSPEQRRSGTAGIAHLYLTGGPDPCLSG